MKTLGKTLVWLVLIVSVIVIFSVTLWCIFGKEKAAAGEEHA